MLIRVVRNVITKGKNNLGAIQRKRRWTALIFLPLPASWGIHAGSTGFGGDSSERRLALPNL
jgi:hypothetical protein